ncbi:hypothetical protein OROMI_003044 [Orobanche minor]
MILKQVKFLLLLLPAVEGWRRCLVEILGDPLLQGCYFRIEVTVKCVLSTHLHYLARHSQIKRLICVYIFIYSPQAALYGWKIIVADALKSLKEILKPKFPEKFFRPA